ncbi:MAG: radical SAM protein [Acidaminococcales bacterium]|jgi:radical SAM superfamily enzyme YgiQ (UPF0313 family)|nr:radical SAM protein [Acidaminococcales bacterium]
MYFDDEPGPVFRPPSEAESFILRVTVGCSHNACTYCNMYRTVKFHVKAPADVSAQIRAAAATGLPVKKVFLSDGDALVLSTGRLIDILSELRAAFPKLQRVAAYAGPRAILGKNPQDLRVLRENGLKLLYYGMETGDDRLLKEVNKGVDAREAVEAGCRVRAAGIKLSMMIIAGLGGAGGSAEHARHTAEAVNIIKPDMLSALTLMLYRGSELKEKYERGDFDILTPPQIMDELCAVLRGIDLPPGSCMLFRSNHISNYFSLAGTLPKDKERLLRQAEAARSELAKMPFYDPYNNAEHF